MDEQIATITTPALRARCKKHGRSKRKWGTWHEAKTDSRIFHEHKHTEKMNKKSQNEIVCTTKRKIVEVFRLSNISSSAHEFDLHESSERFQQKRIRGTIKF